MHSAKRRSNRNGYQGLTPLVPFGGGQSLTMEYDMFTQFILILSIPRDKVAIIKMLRQIAGYEHPLGSSLKTCKDAVEDQISFGDMDDFVSIKLKLDEAGVGRAAYYTMKHPTAGIVDIVGIEIDLYDFDLAGD